MDTLDPIAKCLADIAALLRTEGYDVQARDVEALLAAAASPLTDQQAWFRAEITQNKWYWLGMGTIADIALADHELNRRLKRAYYDLAVACESAGLGSIYSRDVQTIYGEWMRTGRV